MYCFNFFRNKLWRRLVSYNSFTFSCFLFPVGGGGSKRFEDWRGGGGKKFRTWGLPVCGGTFAGGFSTPLQAMITVKFKLSVHVPDFYSFWSIIKIFFDAFHYNKWSAML